MKNLIKLIKLIFNIALWLSLIANLAYLHVSVYYIANDLDILKDMSAKLVKDQCLTFTNLSDIDVNSDNYVNYNFDYSKISDLCVPDTK